MVENCGDFQQTLIDYRVVQPVSCAMAVVSPTSWIRGCLHLFPFVVEERGGLRVKENVIPTAHQSSLLPQVTPLPALAGFTSFTCEGGGAMTRRCNIVSKE